jgi:cytochrome c oxidase subunit 2
MTTIEMREKPEMIEKVANINKIREEKSKELVADGKTALDPYTFDYLLLCNKICGASHYNMQMKVVVDTPEDYKKWLVGKGTIVEVVKKEASEAAKKKSDDAAASKTDTTATKKDTTMVAVAEGTMNNKK